VVASVEGSQGSFKKYALIANLPQALASNLDLPPRGEIWGEPRRSIKANGSLVFFEDPEGGGIELSFEETSAGSKP